MISQNINDIQNFLDLINFYGRFIKNFNRIVASLSSMLKKSSELFRKNKFKKRKRNSNFSKIKNFLIVETKEIFEKLKNCFMTKFLLHHFDFRCKFDVETNAFNKIINDVLCQQILNDNDWHLIIYFSFKMNSTQCNYEIYDQEFLAIIEIFKH